MTPEQYGSETREAGVSAGLSFLDVIRDVTE
jgi:hypothetical protein